MAKKSCRLPEGHERDVSVSSNALSTYKGHPWNRKLIIFATYTVWISLGKALHL